MNFLGSLGISPICKNHMNLRQYFTLIMRLIVRNEILSCNTTYKRGVGGGTYNYILTCSIIAIVNDIKDR